MANNGAEWRFRGCTGLPRSGQRSLVKPATAKLRTIPTHPRAQLARQCVVWITEVVPLSIPLGIIDRFIPDRKDFLSSNWFYADTWAFRFTMSLRHSTQCGIRSSILFFANKTGAAASRAPVVKRLFRNLPTRPSPTWPSCAAGPHRSHGARRCSTTATARERSR